MIADASLHFFQLACSWLYCGVMKWAVEDHQRLPLFSFRCLKCKKKNRSFSVPISSVRNSTVSLFLSRCFPCCGGDWSFSRFELILHEFVLQKGICRPLCTAVHQPSSITISVSIYIELELFTISSLSVDIAHFPPD